MFFLSHLWTFPMKILDSVDPPPLVGTKYQLFPKFDYGGSPNVIWWWYDSHHMMTRIWYDMTMSSILFENISLVLLCMMIWWLSYDDVCSMMMMMMMLYDDMMITYMPHAICHMTILSYGIYCNIKNIIGPYYVLYMYIPSHMGIWC